MRWWLMVLETAGCHGDSLAWLSPPPTPRHANDQLNVQNLNMVVYRGAAQVSHLI